MARNYLRIPWSRTHAIPVLTVGNLRGAPLVFYPDHPPLVPLLIAGVYARFGVGDWQTRLPASLATIATAYALYLLLARAGSARAGLLAAAVFAAMPMNLYFGGLPEVVGMPMVLFVVVTVLVYAELHRRPTGRRCALLLATFTLAAVSDWPAFVLVPVLSAHFVLTRPIRTWPLIAAFGAGATALFALLYTYIAWAADLPWTWMLPLFEGRAAIGVPAPFTAREWWATTLAFNRDVHTLPVLVVAAAWIAVPVLRARAPAHSATIASILLAWGVLHVAIARQGVFNHEWWWSPLTPGLAVAAALTIEGAISFVEERTWAGAGSITAAVLTVAFATWTIRASYGELNGSAHETTTVDLGRAIRAAAPNPNDVALLVWGGDDPQLWFYGDRPLKLNVWSVEDMVARLGSEHSDLVFSYEQPWLPPPARDTGVVFPAEERDVLQKLYDYLRARYRRIALPADLATKFEIFDITN